MLAPYNIAIQHENITIGKLLCFSSLIKIEHYEKLTEEAAFLRNVSVEQHGYAR